MNCNCKIQFLKNPSKSARALFVGKCYFFRIFVILTPLNEVLFAFKHVIPEQFCAKKSQIPQCARILENIRVSEVFQFWHYSKQK